MYTFLSNLPATTPRPQYFGSILPLPTPGWLPVPNCYTAVVRGVGPIGQDIINTFAYLHSNNNNPGVATSIANAVDQHVVPLIAAGMASACRIQGVTVHSEDHPRTISVDVPIIPNIVGTELAPAAASNAALAVSKRSNFAGRAHRGRFFLGGFSTAAFREDRAGTLTLQRALNVASGFIDLAGYVYGIIPVVVSHKYGLATYAASVLIDTIGDSMRNRLPGRGR